MKIFTENREYSLFLFLFNVRKNIHQCKAVTKIKLRIIEYNSVPQNVENRQLKFELLHVHSTTGINPPVVSINDCD